MARKPNTQAAAESQANFPPHDGEGPDAELAFEAHVTLLTVAKARPWLTQNPYFTALQDTAYQRFLAAFEVL